LFPYEATIKSTDYSPYAWVPHVSECLSDFLV